MKRQYLAIDRPIGASLLAVAIILAGLFALHRLGIAALPAMPVQRLIVAVNQPGGSPNVIASTVIAPLERHLARTPGLVSMYSSSSVGQGYIQLSFSSNVNMDRAFRWVQAGVSESSTDLPAGLGEPVVLRTDVNAIPTVQLVMTSSRQAPGDLIKTANSFVVPLINAISGVSSVNVYGVEPDQVIVELDLARLASVGLTSNDVGNIITAASYPTAVGTLDNAGTRLTLMEPPAWASTKDLGSLVLFARNGASVRLSDVAQISHAPRDPNNISWYDGAPAVVVQVFKAPTGDALKIDDEISEKFRRIETSLPSDARLYKSFSSAPATRTAVRDASVTLLASSFLVALTCLFFLKDQRTTFAAVAAIPLGIAGTLVAMAACGYTLNLLTLLALTICVSFIVDDAIIVSEAVKRLVEKGLSPRDAASQAAKDLRFTILSISLSLACAFIPLLLGTDSSLEMFRSFSVTLICCVFVSAAVALLLVPALSSPPRGRGSEPSENWIGGSKSVERVPSLLSKLLQGYGAILDGIIRYRALLGWLPLVLIAATVYGYNAIENRFGVGFMPPEDTRLLQVSVDYDPGISPAVRLKHLSEVDQAVRADPSVAHTSTGSSIGGAFLNVELVRGAVAGKDDEAPMGEVVARLAKAVRGIPGVAVGIFPVNYLGTSEGVGKDFPGRVSTFELVSRDGTELRPWVKRLSAALEQRFGRGSVSSEFDQGPVEQEIVVDRDKAGRLGIRMGDIDADINQAFADNVVGTMGVGMEAEGIVLRATASQRTSMASLLNLHVRAQDGSMVPLSAIAQVRPLVSPTEIRHLNQLETAVIGFRTEPGLQAGEFTAFIRATLQDIHAPPGIIPQFSSESSHAEEIRSNTLEMLLLSMAGIYLLLGILYEDLVHPITILVSIPAATAGAMLAMYFGHVRITLMSELSLLLLIAMVKKNAILIVDSALQLERQGARPSHAIKQACMLRLRPILMTTITSLVAAVPLALGLGRGSDVTRPLGIALVGGILASQILSLAITPAAYLWRGDFVRMAQFMRRQLYRF